MSSDKNKKKKGIKSNGHEPNNLGEDTLVVRRRSVIVDIEKLLENDLPKPSAEYVKEQAEDIGEVTLREGNRAIDNGPLDPQTFLPVPASEHRTLVGRTPTFEMNQYNPEDEESSCQLFADTNPTPESLPAFVPQPELNNAQEKQNDINRQTFEKLDALHVVNSGDFIPATNASENAGLDASIEKEMVELIHGIEPELPPDFIQTPGSDELDNPFFSPEPLTPQEGNTLLHETALSEDLKDLFPTEDNEAGPFIPKDLAERALSSVQEEFDTEELNLSGVRLINPNDNRVQFPENTSHLDEGWRREDLTSIEQAFFDEPNNPDNFKEKIQNDQSGLSFDLQVERRPRHNKPVSVPEDFAERKVSKAFYAVSFFLLAFVTLCGFMYYRNTELSKENLFLQNTTPKVVVKTKIEKIVPVGYSNGQRWFLQYLIKKGYRPKKAISLKNVLDGLPKFMYDSLLYSSHLPKELSFSVQKGDTLNHALTRFNSLLAEIKMKSPKTVEGLKFPFERHYGEKNFVVDFNEWFALRGYSIKKIMKLKKSWDYRPATLVEAVNFLIQNLWIVSEWKINGNERVPNILVFDVGSGHIVKIMYLFGEIKIIKCSDTMSESEDSMLIVKQ